MYNLSNRHIGFWIGAIELATFMSGCTVHPPGEREERSASLVAGKAFQKPLEQRNIPPLPDNPTTAELVHHAMLTNGNLEAAYWQWRSAIEQIPQDGTQTATLNVSFGSAITRGRTSSGMSTIGLANDPMTDIKWPGKLDAAARIALENARAAGHRFRKAQFELRSKVLSAYYDYSLTAELIRLEQANHGLLVTTETVSQARNRAGSGGQQDVLRTRNDLDLSNNDIANMTAQLVIERAVINTLLSRPIGAMIPVPTALPEARVLEMDDAHLLAMVSAGNPELGALAAESRGRGDAIQLARLQYFPDFNLGGGTDLAGITQNILGQATIPLFRYEALNAGIAQAEANLRITESTRRQMVNDLASQVVLDVSTIRDADRQLALFEQTILPRARQIVDVSRVSYENSHATLWDVLESQRTLIFVNRLVANLRIVRAKRLADLEAIAGLNLEPG